MAEVVLDIERWGNDLGVRLPAAVIRKAHLRAGQRVRVTVERGRVVITPLSATQPSLEERLARFDPVRHHGEVMAADRLGAERW